MNGGIHTIEEALGDITRYLDEQTIAHLIADQKQADQRGVMSQYQRFSRMAEQEPDARKKIYYEFRALLPEDLARKLAMEYYQKEIRNGVYSLDSMMDSPDGEGEMESSALNIKGSYGNPNITKGMFETMLNKGMDTPERRLEVSDLFEKLIDNLGRAARIILITRLVTGASTGKIRQKEGSPMFGLDLTQIVRKIPAEYNLVMNQIKALEKETLVKPEHITSTLIFNGTTKMVGNDERKVERIIGKREITSGNEELQKALMKLSGASDLKELVAFLDVRESKDDVPAGAMLKAIEAILSGGKVELSTLIRVIVMAVSANIKGATDLSLSKAWSGRPLKEIARSYLNMAKIARTELDWMPLQDLIMAPVFDKENPLAKLVK
jgi:hypothetical protein